MKPNLKQQAIAGIAVLLVVAATIAGGVILTVSDNPAATSQRRTPTATPYSIATLAQATRTTALVATDTPESATRTTNTPRPTATSRSASPTPFPTATEFMPDDTSTTVAQAISCTVPAGWSPYIVQRGDNLYRIGLAYGLTAAKLQTRNCLVDIRVTVGQIVYVPPVTPRALATAVSTTDPDAPPVPFATGDATQTATDGSCTSADSVITAPVVGAILNGVQEFRGTATRDDFSFYKLEIRQEGYSTPEDFITFYTSDTAVVNGSLGTLLTEAFTNGEYWIRLTVVDSTGNYLERCSILYVIQN